MIPMRYYCLFILFFCSLTLGATKPEKVSAEYEYLSSDRNESQAQAEQQALLLAKQQALEDRFGVDISSISVLLQSERTVDDKISSEEDFYSLGGMSSRGEWISTTKEQVLSSRHNGEYWTVKVYVEGIARAKNGAYIDIDAVFTNRPDGKYKVSDYQSDDRLYLRFSSPADGALCVYLVDENKQALCLLPNSDNNIGYQPIKANTEYLFFTDEEIQLTIDNNASIVNNVLYVVFSPTRFVKANDKDMGRNQNGDYIPRALPYKQFLEWLSQNQIKDERMLVRTEHIIIRR